MISYFHFFKDFHDFSSFSSVTIIFVRFTLFYNVHVSSFVIFYIVFHPVPYSHHIHYSS